MGITIRRLGASWLGRHSKVETSYGFSKVRGEVRQLRHQFWKVLELRLMLSPDQGLEEISVTLRERVSKSYLKRVWSLAEKVYQLRRSRVQLQLLLEPKESTYRRKGHPFKHMAIDFKRESKAVMRGCVLWQHFTKCKSSSNTSSNVSHKKVQSFGVKDPPTSVTSALGQ